MHGVLSAPMLWAPWWKQKDMVNARRHLVELTRQVVCILHHAIKCCHVANANTTWINWWYCINKQCCGKFHAPVLKLIHVEMERNQGGNYDGMMARLLVDPGSVSYMARQLKPLAVGLSSFCQPSLSLTNIFNRYCLNWKYTFTKCVGSSKHDDINITTHIVCGRVQATTDSMTRAVEATCHNEKPTKAFIRYFQ